jgi:uncharacterized protein
MKYEFNESRAFKHSNFRKLEYIGKCLLIKSDGKKILAVGDLHLGYEEYLNRTGIFVSRKMFEEMMAYLERIFDKVGKVDEIVLLGDVKHDFGSVMKQEWNDVLNLFDYLKDKCSRIIAIMGNHDKILEPIARKRDIKVRDFYVSDEFCFLHGDKDFKEIYDDKVRYWVVGHGHPAVKISDGVKIEKYKCFLVGKFKGKEIVIVPSFIEANEGSDPRENELGLAWDFDLNQFKVFVVSDDFEVLGFGKLKKL